MHYLLSDVAYWDLERECLILHPSQKLQHTLLKFRSTVVHSNMTSSTVHLEGYPDTHFPITHSTPGSSTDSATSQSVYSTLPSLKHWILQVSTNKTSDIPSLSLSQLRRYWHPHWKFILDRSSDTNTSTPLTFTYPPSFWKQFWRLPIPHKAFTPWWRLLQHCISTQQKLHRFRVPQIDSDMCTICKIDEEDIQHMFTACSSKRQFWHAALDFLHLRHLFPTQALVWRALTSFDSYQHRPLNDSILCRLGCIIAILWQHHWRCKIDDQPWSTPAALSTLQADLLYVSFVPSSLPNTV